MIARVFDCVFVCLCALVRVFVGFRVCLVGRAPGCLFGCDRSGVIACVAACVYWYVCLFVCVIGWLFA